MRIAILLVLFPLAAQAQTELEHWARTHFPRAVLQTFINDRKCILSEAELAACRAGLHAAAEFAGRRDSSWASRVEFEEDFRELEPMLGESRPTQAMYGSAVNAYLHAYDPFAELRPSEALLEEYFGPTQNFVGVGLVLDGLSGEVLVQEVVDDSPAGLAGILTDDVIVAIALREREFEEVGDRVELATAMLMGEMSTVVKVRVRRDGKPIEYNLKRAVVREPYVSTATFGDTAYVRIHSFANYEVRQKVAAALRRVRARKLVLDLRGNAGGEKSEATYISSLFLGAKVVTGIRFVASRIPGLGEMLGIENPAGSDTIWERGILERARFTGAMAVLIDGDTASASELVAGALQDHGRAWLIGRRSQGKGSAQHYQPLADYPTLNLKWTSQSWLLPSGRTIQGVGLYPDFEVARRAEGDGFLHEDREGVENRPVEAARLRNCARSAGVSKLAGGDRQLGYALQILSCEASK